MITTDISIATHTPEGIVRVAGMLAEPMDGVRYVVSWQNHGGIPVPENLQAREDVIVVRCAGRGLSVNRNNSLAHCDAELVVITDDDVRLMPEGISLLRQIAEEHPEVDVFTFRSDMPRQRCYPAGAERLKLHGPKGYNVAAIEIALRGRMLGKIRFCPEFGLGSPRLHGGEDEMLVHAAIRRGYNCTFFPVTVACHPHESTGEHRNPTPQVIMASGACIALMYPLSGWLRLPLKAWRMQRGRGTGLWCTLKWLLKGASEGRRVLSRNHDTLW